MIICRAGRGETKLFTARYRLKFRLMAANTEKHPIARLLQSGRWYLLLGSSPPFGFSPPASDDGGIGDDPRRVCASGVATTFAERPTDALSAEQQSPSV